MKTTINGVEYHFDELGEDESSLALLRERLGLTGTKSVCGGGVCGACTVLVEGTPMVSCLLPAHHLDERSVQTVEAHGPDNLHPVQKALMVCDGLQCGFCTPGYVNEGIAFYTRWRAEHGTTPPDRETIAAALAGHLCRCGAYLGIYEAMARACAGEFDDVATVEAARVDALEKVTGQARYTVDVHYDGQLEGMILRSPHAHAEVIEVDASAALAMDGVVGFANLLEGRRTVRYVGEPIAAVAAVNRRVAKAAIEAVQVRYDVRPAAIGLDAARARNAAPVYPEGKKDVPSAAEGFTMPGTWDHNTRRTILKMNLLGAGKARRLIGDAQAKGERGLVKRTYRNATQVHTPLEPHAAVAHWQGPTKLRVHASSQSVHALRAEIAEHFDLENEQVQVLADHVGGGFGGKQGMYNEIVAAITLARVTNAPVRVAVDRLEELSYTGLRPGGEVDVSLLAAADGAPKALRVQNYNDAGVAVGSMLGGLLGLMTPNLPKDLDDFNVVNNTPPGKPFRGPDGPTAMWVYESALDEAAFKLGMDPLDLHRRWDVDHDLRRRLYDWVGALPVWQQRGQSGAQTGRFRRGVGLAMGSWLFIYNPNVKVSVSATPAGIAIRTASQDIGNGTRTVLGKVIEEVFGVPRNEAIVEIGNSDMPLGPTAGGSQVTTSIYPPGRAAAEEVRTYLVEAARTKLSLSDMRVVAGGIEHRGGFLPWKELLAQVEPVTVTKTRRVERGPLGIPMKMPGSENAPSVGPRLSHGVTVTEVEVDTRLGKVRPLHVWSALAVGKIFVPVLARSQVYGGVIQGLGYALYEEKQIDLRTGHNLTANLEEYKIPGIGDTPPMDVHFIEGGYDEIDGGGIGLAELATVGVAASVGNAVFNATGWRPLNTPIRPQDVVAGMQ